MWALVRKDFAHMRNYLLQIAGIFLAVIIVFSKLEPNMIATYFRILPILMGMTIPQVIFVYEERGNAFTFLRSLPLRPQQIVAAKYVFTLLLVMGISLFSVGAITLVANEYAPIDLHLIVLISSALMALSLYLHFRLGVNSAKVALLVLLVGIGAIGGGIYAMPKGKQVLASLFTPELLTRIGSFASRPRSVLVTAALSASLILVSYLASAGLFTRRDVTQLP